MGAITKLSNHGLLSSAINSSGDKGDTDEWSVATIVQ
jgi:hypothetical protein